MFQRGQRRSDHENPYRIIPESEFSLQSYKRCFKSDAYNLKQYRKLLKIKGEIGLDIRSRYPYPIRSNVERYLDWKEHNIMVPADQQAMAVEFLLDHHEVVPIRAWDRATAVNGKKPLNGFPYNNIPEDTDRRYIYLKDLHLKTFENCVKADRINLSRWHQYMKTTASLIHLFPRRHVFCASLKTPRINNVSAKMKQLYDSRLVNASHQRDAVILLYQGGKRVYRDYQPQQAIYLANSILNERAQEVPPPYSTEWDEGEELF
jgi:hypothetical protein